MARKPLTGLTANARRPKSRKKARRGEDELLRNIAAGVSAATGDDFFRSLVRYLAKTLGVDFAYVGELTGEDKQSVNTVSECVRGKIVDNFRYDLANTPCENVVTGDFCIYPRNVQQLFPRDPMLRKMGAESYIGIPLTAASGETLGLMVVMDSKPLDDPKTAESMLQIFAARAGAELERRRAEAALRESEANLRALAENAKDGILVNMGGRHVFANRQFADMLGYTVDELLGTTIDDLVHPDQRDFVKKRYERRLKGKSEPDQYELVFVSKHGESIPTEITVSTSVWQGQPAAIVIVRDIRERKWVEEELAIRARQQAAVAELGQHALADVGLGALIDRAVRLVAGTLKTEYSKVLELRSDGNALLLRAGIGWKEGVVGRAVVDAGINSQAGYTLLSSTPVVVEDLRTETRFDGSPLLYDHGVVSGMSVVIHGKERPFGILSVHAKEIRKFSRDDINFLRAIANVLATAIERKRTEETLQKSRASLAEAQHMARVGNWEWEVVTNEVSWSDEIYRIFGLTLREFRGSYEMFLKSVHPEDRERVKRAVNEALYENKPYSIDHRIVLPNGEVRFVHSQAEVARYESGKPIRMVGTVQDITERKQTEQRVRVQQAALLELTTHETIKRGNLEAALKLITETAARTLAVDRVGIWFFEDNHSKIRCIDLYERGADRHTEGAELVAKDYPTYFRALEADRVIAAHDVHVNPNTKEFSASYLTPLGITSMLDAPIRLGGELIGVVCHEHVGPARRWTSDEQNFAGSIADMVTLTMELRERRQAEEALRASEEKTRLLLESTGEAIYGVDLDGNCTFANPACLKLLGYGDVAQILGKNMHALIHHTRVDGRPHSTKECHISHAFHAGKGTHSGDELLWRRDGTSFHAETWSYPIRRDGKIIGAVVTFVDITERRQAEAQMGKLSRALEQTADSVVITDKEGVIEYVNPAFETTTGFTRAEAVGRKPNIVKSGRHGQAFYERLWSTILKGEVFSDVMVNRKKDGALYYEEKTITPLKDAKGNITHFVSTGKDITERMQTQERLHHLAHHDILTDLPNRMLFMDRLEHALSRARWAGRLVAVLFLDMDRFKIVNDTLGHDVGDRLLQAFGRRLRACVREGDTVARHGGDEFVIVLEDIAAVDDVPATARKILDALAPPFQIDGRELFVTSSIGISLHPNDGRDAPTLLKNADAAMYRAKDMGRNTYQFYSADMGAKAFERLTLETSLRHALRRKEFLLYYQPQVDMDSGRIVGVEALLRWQHPDLGLVLPGDFIPLLEDTGLIVPVGEWVLQTACTQAKAWQRAGLPPVRLTVNLSARQFAEPNLTDTVARILNEVDLDPAFLELEITESVIMQNAQATIDTLAALGNMGVRFAIDDFGTGYSSLSYLKRFSINTLKIDRSFVRDITTDPDDAAIITTIVAMAHNLKLNVVAEGVETEEQLAFLRAGGCDGFQGYLFSRPVAAEKLARLLQRKIIPKNRADAAEQN